MRLEPNMELGLPKQGTDLEIGCKFDPYLISPTILKECKMKQQCYNKLIRLMDEHREDHDALKNLVTKGLILNEGGDKCASVVKELMNG